MSKWDDHAMAELNKNPSYREIFERKSTVTRNNVSAKFTLEGLQILILSYGRIANPTGRSFSQNNSYF